MGRMSLGRAVAFGLVLTAATLGAASSADGQRTVKVMDGWVSASPSTETTAFAVVENGTMYDIFIVGAEASTGGAVQLMQTANGKPTPVKEVMVAAFDRLEMSLDGTFLKLTQLKQPPAAGENVTVVLLTDSGERLSVTAVVK